MNTIQAKFSYTSCILARTPPYRIVVFGSQNTKPQVSDI